MQKTSRNAESADSSLGETEKNAVHDLLKVRPSCLMYVIMTEFLVTLKSEDL